MKNDPRIILTLDAGGTNFLFSALQGGQETGIPVHLSTDSSDLDTCIRQLKHGFHEVIRQSGLQPAAISFAFPGPADYPNGILGDLPNFPCFRGGVPLGPILEEEFDVPVFINNDGDLFAYGEALAGALPYVNGRLEALGSSKRFRHLIGVTFGTGFGCGVVIDGHLLRGDNSSGGDLWCFRNPNFPHLIIEESVSIRAVRRVYAERSGQTDELTPKDIFDIAEGLRPGDRQAARDSFAELGAAAGEALASAVTLVDGLIVIGGELAGAARYILPALMQRLDEQLSTFAGTTFPRLQMKPYCLEDETVWPAFAQGEERRIEVPGTSRILTYDTQKRIGVLLARNSTSRSISLGAWAFALHQLGKK